VLTPNGFADLRFKDSEEFHQDRDRAAIHGIPQESEPGISLVVAGVLVPHVRRNSANNSDDVDFREVEVGGS
jgi:hypothetical protein